MFSFGGLAGIFVSFFPLFPFFPPLFPFFSLFSFIVQIMSDSDNEDLLSNYFPIRTVHNACSVISITKQGNFKVDLLASVAFGFGVSGSGF